MRTYILNFITGIYYKYDITTTIVQVGPIVAVTLIIHIQATVSYLPSVEYEFPGRVYDSCDFDDIYGTFG